MFLKGDRVLCSVTKVRPKVMSSRPKSYTHAQLFVEELLEFGPFVLDGVFMQVGLKAVDGVIHPVPLHQAQDPGDPSDAEKMKH